MQSMRMGLALLVAFWTIGVSDAAATKVKMLDECDPATFNAIGLGVICDVNFDGGVTFPEFASLLSLQLLATRLGGLTFHIFRFNPTKRCKSETMAVKTIPLPRCWSLAVDVSLPRIHPWD